jgi:hypothetical protein
VVGELTGVVSSPAGSSLDEDVPDDAVLSGDDEGDDGVRRGEANTMVVVALSIASRGGARVPPKLPGTGGVRDLDSPVRKRVRARGFAE